MRWGVPLDAAVALSGGGQVEVEGSVLTLADPDYPSLLRQVPGAPPVLFLQGRLDLLRRPAVAMVGARRCTDTGRRMARALSRAVVDAGGVVVSGLAWGIDTAAHEAAVGATVAVLGQGLGVPLSGLQRRTADGLLAQGGLLVSEYPPDQVAARWTFPQRNRVIAGLSRATVVVEASRGSGALITARWASELNREVLAVPGSPLAEASQGCLDLIEAGARMARDGAAVLDAARLDAGPTLDPEQAGLVAAMVGSPTFEVLLSRCGRSAVEVSRLLAGLELTGLVERLPGDRYRLRPPVSSVG